MLPTGSPASRFPTLSVPRHPRCFSAGPATSSLPLCAFVASPLARLEVLARSKSPPGGPPNSEQLCPQAVQPSASKWGAAGIAQRVDPAAPSRSEARWAVSNSQLSPRPRVRVGDLPPYRGGRRDYFGDVRFPRGKTPLYGANVLGTRRPRGGFTRFGGGGAGGRRQRRRLCFVIPAAVSPSVAENSRGIAEPVKTSWEIAEAIFQK